MNIIKKCGFVTVQILINNLSTCPITGCRSCYKATSMQAGGSPFTDWNVGQFSLEKRKAYIIAFRDDAWRSLHITGRFAIL
jgi:hypothetical protein